MPVNDEIARWAGEFLGWDPAKLIESNNPDPKTGQPRQTTPLGTVTTHEQQKPPILDPTTGKQTSESSHVWPASHIIDQTTDPVTGDSPYTKSPLKDAQGNVLDSGAYNQSPTIKTTRATEEARTQGAGGDEKALLALRSAAKAGNVTQTELDSTSLEAGMQRQLRAGATDPSVTELGTALAGHGQAGVLFDRGSLQPLMRSTPDGSAPRLSPDDIDKFSDDLSDPSTGSFEDKVSVANDSFAQPRLPKADVTLTDPPNSGDPPDTGNVPSAEDADPTSASANQSVTYPASNPPPEAILPTMSEPPPQPAAPAELAPTPTIADQVTPPQTAAASAAADGATSSEAGAASGIGGIAGAGILGGVIAGGVALASDFGKVTSGEMSAGDAAVDVGGKAAETGALTSVGVALATKVATTASGAGGVVGAVVGAGVALVDDVSKVEAGTMTGGQATVDVGTKGAIGAAAGALGALAGGAVAGSELGAALGTIVPGAGNVVGFVAGAAVGAVVGIAGNALANTETGQKVEAAVGGAVDKGIGAVKDAGHAIASLFGGDDPPPSDAAPPPQDPQPAPPSSDSATPPPDEAANVS